MFFVLIVWVGSDLVACIVNFWIAIVSSLNKCFHGFCRNGAKRNGGESRENGGCPVGASVRIQPPHNYSMISNDHSHLFIDVLFSPLMLFIGLFGQSCQYLVFGSFLIFAVQEHRSPLVIQVFSSYCHCSAPFACSSRILMSPEYTQAAVCTILSMIASAWIPPPSRLCQSSRLYCVQKIVEVQS